MYDLGDKFEVIRPTEKTFDELDDGDRVIDEITDKSSTNNNGNITVSFEVTRYYESTGEEIRVYTDVRESQLESEAEMTNGGIEPIEE